MIGRVLRGTARISRRVFIAIAVVVVAAILGIAGILRLRRPPVTPTPTPMATPTPTETPQVTPTPPTPDLVVSRVDKVPVRDPDDPVWGKAREVEFSLGPQAMVKPFKLAPSVTSVKVRALRDEEWIAFRLEWVDGESNLRSFDVHEFRDACAVMMLSHPIPADKLGIAWQMGTPEHPTTILFWRGDWQLDIEKSYQDITDIFPNMAIDTYPPYHPAVVKEEEPKPKKIGLVKEELRYIAGFSAGNPMVRLDKKSPVEKLIGKGPGTIEEAKDQDAEGWGKFADGRWRVVLAKKLKATNPDQGELEIKPGSYYYIAIAVWQGSEGDRGSRKAITPLKLIFVE